MVEDDPEWIRLLELEIELEPISTQCRAIRKQIASVERCHEHYTGNVKTIMAMIGSMKPGRILDCGDACGERREEARAYRQALQTWLEADALPDQTDEYTREVFDMLAERTDAKLPLVQHLVGKLGDNGYRVYCDDDEDFALTESRIQHLDICNYNWRENLRIVFQEIAAGKRLFDWHMPNGYNAHGDCPDRVAELREIAAAAKAWAVGNASAAGEWGQLLGEPTPEKRWLLASLCKHVRADHQEFDDGALLAQPTL
jgi:hypothetical protein